MASVRDGAGLWTFFGFRVLSSVLLYKEGEGEGKAIFVGRDNVL
jgi:hypothetical protein